MFLIADFFQIYFQIAGTLSKSSVEGVEGGVDTLECVIATPVQTSDPNETSQSCFELMDKGKKKIIELMQYDIDFHVDL